MAIGFGTTYGSASTDRLVTTNTTSNSTESWAFWLYDNGTGGGAIGTVFDKRNSGIAGFRIFRVKSGDATKYEFFASWNSAGNSLVDNLTRSGTTGAWHHWVITYDSSSTANDIVAYMDGSSVTVTRATAPSGTADTNTDPYCIGNYNISPYGRNWDGMIAEFGNWSVILNASEAAALGKGMSPLSVRPTALKDYLPMVRGTGSKKLAAPTVTGTAVNPHPRVIMPHRRGIRRFTTAAAGGVFTPYWYRQHIARMGA